MGLCSLEDSERMAEFEIVLMVGNFQNNKSKLKSQKSKIKMGGAK
jgi:hypothetical protein